MKRKLKEKLFPFYLSAFSFIFVAWLLFYLSVFFLICVFDFYLYCFFFAFTYLFYLVMRAFSFICVVVLSFYAKPFDIVQLLNNSTINFAV